MDLLLLRTARINSFKLNRLPKNLYEIPYNWIMYKQSDFHVIHQSGNVWFGNLREPVKPSKTLRLIHQRKVQPLTQTDIKSGNLFNLKLSIRTNYYPQFLNNPFGWMRMLNFWAAMYELNTVSDGKSYGHFMQIKVFCKRNSILV